MDCEKIVRELRKLKLIAICAVCYHIVGSGCPIWAALIIAFILA